MQVDITEDDEAAMLVDENIEQGGRILEEALHMIKDAKSMQLKVISASSIN